MAKTNYTKVEEALTEGLRKMTINHLLELADLASKKEGKSHPTEKDERNVTARSQLINAIENDLKVLKKHDQDVYAKVEIKSGDLRKFLEHPELLSPGEWEKVKQIKELVSSYKKELLSKLPQNSDEEIVALERKKHINKRFNIREKWLPLK